MVSRTRRWMKIKGGFGDSCTRNAAANAPLYGATLVAPLPLFCIASVSVFIDSLRQLLIHVCANACKAGEEIAEFILPGFEFCFPPC